MITYEEAKKIIIETKERNKKAEEEEVKNYCDTYVSELIRDAVQKGKNKISIGIPASFSDEQKSMFIKIFNDNGYQKHMLFVDNCRFTISF